MLKENISTKEVIPTSKMVPLQSTGWYPPAVMNTVQYRYTDGLLPKVLMTLLHGIEHATHYCTDDYLEWKETVRNSRKSSEKEISS